MNDQPTPHRDTATEDAPRDPRLEEMLRTWTAPPVPGSLDARVLESYRRLKPPPLWRRLLLFTVPVPLPVAVAVVALLVASVLVRRPAAPQAPAWVAEARAPRTAVDPPLVTRTSLAGFQPVADLTVTVISESRTQ